jgi:hypothetical protein
MPNKAIESAQSAIGEEIGRVVATELEFAAKRDGA